MLSPATLGKLLGQIRGFSDVDHAKEQHETPVNIASEFLALARNDITNKTVADLGAGTGMLGIGAALLGATVTAYETDEGAIQIMEQNCNNLDVEVNIVHTDVTISDIESVDTVIMNPPFGTKQKNIDTVFLEKAMKASNVIWTMHKSSTLEYLKKFVSRNNWSITYTQHIQFPIANTHAMHEKPKKNIDVVVLRLTKQ